MVLHLQPADASAFVLLSSPSPSARSQIHRRMLLVLGSHGPSYIEAGCGSNVAGAAPVKCRLGAKGVNGVVKGTRCKAKKGTGRGSLEGCS